MAWYDPLDNAAQNKQIDEINIQLVIYAAAYQNKEHTKDHLDKIISACEQYISSISKSERMAFVYGNDEQVKEANNTYPNLEKIVAIQKQAVRNQFLPAAKNEAAAMWKLIRGLALSDSKQGVAAGKMLDKDYWTEYVFKGDTAIAGWMSDNYRDSRVTSWGEILNQKKVLHQSDVQYFENNEQFKIEFREGLLYLNNRELDTRKARSALHNLYGEVIYAVDVEGSLYTSDPSIEIKHDIHHSSFLKGKRVLCAGTMKVINGEIQLITIDSGHYKPDKNDLLDFLKILDKNNVPLMNVQVKDQNIGTKTKNAERFLVTNGNCLSDTDYQAAITFKSNLLHMKNTLIMYDHMLNRNGVDMNEMEYERSIVPIVANINTLLEKNVEEINSQFRYEAKNDIEKIIKKAIKTNSKDASDQLILYNDMKKILNNSYSATLTDDNELFVAATNGDLDQIKRIIKKGADVNFIFGDKTPLSAAVAARHDEIVKYMLASGAEPNSQNGEGLTPLHFIEYNDRQNPLQDENSEMNKKIDMDIAAELIAYGANPFTQNHTGELPVDLISNQEIKELLISVSEDYEKIIDLTATSDNAEAINILLEQTGRIFLPPYLTNQVININYDTILHMAAYNGQSDIAKMLIQRGMNPHLQNAEGNTALHLAAFSNENDSNEIRNGKIKIAKMLIEAGVKLNQKNIDGMTPLELSTDKNMKAILSPVKMTKHEEHFTLFSKEGSSLSKEDSSPKSQKDIPSSDQQKHGLS